MTIIEIVVDRSDNMNKIFWIVVLAIFLFACYNLFGFVFSIIARIPFWIWIIAIILILANSRE